MKILIMFLFLTLTTFAQSWHLLWDDAFNPFDANTVAVWSGVDFSDPNWLDQIGSKNLVSTNSPTTGTLNGLRTVIFNGTDEYAENTTLSVTRPFTIYLVLRQITHTDLERIFYNGASGFGLIQTAASPDITFEDPAGTSVSSQLVVNTFNVITLRYGSADKGLRVGLNASINSTWDDEDDLAGLFLATDVGVATFGNIEVAYIIVRNTIDGTEKQNNFINYLKTRFGI